MADVDVVIIGAGHNGLTCAAYLGMAGLSVCVVERRGVVGGTAVTEEFHPGFRNSVAAYTVSLLQPKVIADLNLHQHGLRIVERRAQNFLPVPEGRYLLTGEGRTQREIAKFSARDAERYIEFQAALSEVADLLRELVMHAPPNVTWRHLLQSLPEAIKFAPIGARVLGFDGKARRALFDLYWKSAGDYLDGWFETDAVKALFGFDSIVGNLASPYTHGSAYVLLHHWFGEVNGKKGVWGHAIGGMGAITQAMAKAAGAHGVRDRHRGGSEGSDRRDAAAPRQSCSATARGSTRQAVVANVNPKLPVRAIGAARRGAGASSPIACGAGSAGSGTFRMNVALSALPNFSCPARHPAITSPPGIIHGAKPRLHGHAPIATSRAHGFSRGSRSSRC